MGQDAGGPLFAIVLRTLLNLRENFMDAVQMEVVYRATVQIAKELALNMLRT